MEKLKNLVNPGSKKDDDVMYGTGQNVDDPIMNKGNAAGQGSHFGSSRSNDPLSSSTNPTGTTGTHGLSEPHSSRMPGTFDDDAATTASVRSGIPGAAQSGNTNKPLPTEPGYGTGRTTAGPHSSNLENKFDPRVDSDLDGSRAFGGNTTGTPGMAGTGSGLGGNTTGTGSGFTGSSGYGNPPTGQSHLGRDAALGGAGALGAGEAAHHHHNKHHDNDRGLGSNTAGTGSGLTGDTGTGSGLTGITSGTGSGLTGSSGYGNQPTGSSHQSHLGRDAALGAGAVGVGEAAHHHHDKHDSETGRSFPLGGGTNTNTGSNTGSSYGSGQVGTYPAGGGGKGGNTTAGPHSSNLANKADPRVDSDLHGSRTMGGNSGYGSNTGMGSGVGSGNGSGVGSGNTGYGSNTGVGSGISSGTTSSTHPSNTGHLGRDAAIGAGAAGVAGYGAESWKHDHGKHGHNYEGDPCGPEEAVGGAPHFTSGPHATDTANRLDRHVGSGIGAPGSTTASSIGTGHHHGTRDAALAGGAGAVGVGAYEEGRHHDKRHGQHGEHHTGRDAALAGAAGAAGDGAYEEGRHHNKHHGQHGDHHTGRDAALAGGAGAAGVGAYESSRDHPGSSSTTNPGSSTTGPAPTTAGPHKSDMLNKLDPRVDSDLSKQQGTTGNATGSGMGGSTTGTSSDPYSSSNTGREHHLGRDAGPATGGAGLGGAAAYEGAKHHDHHNTTGNTTGTGLGSSTSGTSSDPYSSSTTGRGLGGSTTDPYSSSNTGRDHHTGRDAGLATGAGLGGVAAYEGAKHHGRHDPTGTTSTTTSTTGSSMPYSSSGIDPRVDSSSRSGLGDTSSTGHDHHYGRDAGMAGVGGVGAYEAEKHFGGHHGSTPQDRLAGSGHHPTTGTTSSNIPPQDRLAGSGHQPTTATDPTRHHTGRDAAAGVGAGALAGHELSKHDEKKLEKEQAKEDKHHHDKHDDGKKSGGLFGFLHKDKSDEDAKHAEHEDRKLASHRPGDEEMAARAGGVDLEDRMARTNLGNQSLAHEHGSQSGVHETPIGIGPTTRDAYGNIEGHNKLHKDPPQGYQ